MALTKGVERSHPFLFAWLQPVYFTSIGLKRVNELLGVSAKHCFAQMRLYFSSASAWMALRAMAFSAL